MYFKIISLSLCERRCAQGIILLTKRLVNRPNLWMNVKRLNSTVATIKVEPHSSLIDVPVQVQITDLKPRQEVTLVAWLWENKMKFMSSACFTADDHGKINLSKHPSVSGTYTGVEPMGFLWSMVQAPGQRYGLRLQKSDVTTPYNILLRVIQGHLQFEDCYNAKNAIASTSFEKFYKEKCVNRIEVREGRIRGTLFIPQDGGKHPGVVDLFGYSGGLMEHRAALLASRGYAALALAFVKYDGLPEALQEIDLSYFEEAIDWLSSQREVAGTQIGIVASCAGANIALQLCTFLPKIKVCVCIGASHFNPEHPMRYGDQVLRKEEWSGYHMAEKRDGGYHFTSVFRTKNHEYSAFKIENSTAQFFFIHGEDDCCVCPGCCDLLTKRLKDHGKSNYTAITYPGAGHLIEPPYTPLCYASYNQFLGDNLIWGGRPRLHAYAQEDSWRKILHFLKVYLTSSTQS